MTDTIMNDIETDAAELRKDADAWDLVAGQKLAAMSTAAYAERLERICEAGDKELAIHYKSISKLPPYIEKALFFVNRGHEVNPLDYRDALETLKHFRERRGAECLHREVESWWFLEGGKAACAARGIS